MADHLTVRDLYEHTAAAWASGAELVYQPMADALVAASPVDLRDRTILDVGAGTGAGSRALLRVGAQPIAVDLAWTMLAHDRAARPPAAVADLYRPPIAPRALGGVLAPFVLNHIDQPVDALSALAGTVAPGGVVLASTFSERDRPPVKDLIDAVALSHGCQPPESYVWMRTAVSPLLGRPAAMAAAARNSGLVDVEVVETAVDTGISDPESLVAYRFSMPHVVRFLDGLSSGERRAIVAEAVAAVAAAHDGSTLAPTVLFLTARVG